MSVFPFKEPTDPRRVSFDDIEIDLTHLVFRKLLVTTIAATIGVAGSTLVMALYYRDNWMGILGLIMFACSSARIALAVAYGTQDQNSLTLEEAHRWKALYAGLLFLGSCLLAVSTVHNFRYHPAVGGQICIITIFSVCCGVSTRPGLRPWVVQVSGLTMLLPLAIMLWSTNQSLGRLGIVGVFLFGLQYCEAVQNQFHIVVEQLRSRRQLRLLSEQDVLTGLANRRHFQNCLADICHTAETFAILYIDLDRFKWVNDTHGHPVGDLLLKRVADRLSGIIRHSDRLARLGGDEFAILQTPVINVYSAQAMAARINRDIAVPFEIEGLQIQIGASVGIRLCEYPEADPNALLSKADQALYRVKQAGGGSFRLAEA